MDRARSSLYLDNFRGFSATTIPLRPVNFLIGENSTGKSSVLALVNLLSSPEFWFFQNFNHAYYEFGGFRDILSATAEGATHFTIGFCRTGGDEGTKHERPECYVLSYVEHGALPKIDFVAQADMGKLLVLRVMKEKYRFKVSDLPPEWGKRDSAELFALLSREREGKPSDFRDLPKNIPARAGLVTILGMLRQTLIEGKSARAAYPFPFRVPTHELVWFAPIRTKPKRTYDGYGRQFSPEGEHTPYLLRKRLSPGSPAGFRKAIEGFGQASGLFSKVHIKRLGEDADAPFELMIELAAQCQLRINSVGYGVSQVLPLVAEMLEQGKHVWFALQQPEVHLHPKAQAALGDLIYQVAETDRKHFLVETHSDFTVDRFRMNLKRNPKHTTEAQVLFFERTETGNQVFPIEIGADGEYPEDQPAHFRDFFLQEHMSMLGL